MKFGLVVYKYTDNIGDDILSYSALRFLPAVDYIIDRENMDTFFTKDGESVKVILNGWYLHNKICWPPSEFIKPFFIGIHFTSSRYKYGVANKFLDGLGKEYLIKNSPIGCRDLFTLDKMQVRNIPAYFSGCLTLTLQKFDNICKTDKVLLVDVPTRIKEKCYDLFPSNNIEIITHNVENEERGQDWTVRKQLVENLLKKYQSASLVLTTRLHCALPCLALGTKVLLITNNSTDDYERKGTFFDYLNNCTDSYFLDSITRDEIDALQNSEKFKVLRENLINSCIEFVNDKKVVYFANIANLARTFSYTNSQF